MSLLNKVKNKECPLVDNCLLEKCKNQINCIHFSKQMKKKNIKKFKSEKKNKILNRITYYLIEEDFPCEHLEAILKMITAFNWDIKTETEIFKFINKLDKKLSAIITIKNN